MILLKQIWGNGKDDFCLENDQFITLFRSPVYRTFKLCSRMRPSGSLRLCGDSLHVRLKFVVPHSEISLFLDF